MFTGSYSWNSKVGFLWLQLGVFLGCDDFSALLKTARSLLFRRATKVRAKCMCTSDTQMTRDGPPNLVPGAMQHPPEKSHVMMLFFILCFLPSVEEGKLDTGEIPSYAGGHLTWIHRVLMAAYLLVTNVLFINLLIAIFSNVFKEVQENSYQI